LERADATDLRFAEGSFDFVFSFIMLHHVLEWERALGEAFRVLRPGGWLIGYDILDTALFRWFHRLEGAEVRLMELRAPWCRSARSAPAWRSS
jgi:ubiquinone/menaquinone biosynthesis C-methylase UbiE